MAWSPESSNAANETDPSSSKSSSKKKEGLAVGQAALESAASTPSPEAAKPSAPESLSKIWDRIVSKPAESSDESKAHSDEATDGKEEEKLPEADADEESAPLDGLSDTEARTVANAEVLEREQAATDERAGLEDGTPEAEAVDAALAFHAAVRNELEDGANANQAIHEGYEQTLGAEAPDETSVFEQGVSVEQGAEGGATVVDGALDYEEPDDTASASYAAANGAAAGTPPRFPGAGANYFDVPGRGRTAGGTAERMDEGDEYSRADVRRASGGGLVVGGIIGYLIGRRQGRLKTERQLLPVQKKLESEVRAIQSQIAVREAHIRATVLERAQTQRRQEATAVRTEAANREAPPTTAERSVPAARSAETARSVETMRTEEVLNVAEKIVTGSTTVRKIYETNLISERGLRRIVNEHLRGGDIQRVLTEELLVKEIGHELDPILRDRPLSNAQTPAAVPVPAPHAVAAQQLDAGTASNEMSADMPPPIARSPQTPAQSTWLFANMIALTILGILILVLVFVWLAR